MEDSDLPFIHQGLSETNWQDIPDDQKPFLDRAECDRRIHEDFERYLETERFKFKVFTAVSEDGSPVGYVPVGESVNPSVGLRFGAVLDFWVAPFARSQGIGGKLLDYALEHIRSQGYSHASILVSASNRKALSMYEKRGFRPDRLVIMKPV